MAYPKSLDQLEREFLYKSLGALAKPAMRLTQLKRMFFEAELGSSIVTEGLESLERRWLKKAITTAEGTPSGDDISSLWKQLLAINSLPVTQYINQNKKVYYSKQIA